MQVLVRDNNVDQALKALKKKMQREGIFREMKLRGHYEKPSEKKAREKAEAIRRARKLARKKMQREGLLPSKPRPTTGGPGGGHRGAPAHGLMPLPRGSESCDWWRGPFRPRYYFEAGAAPNLRRIRGQIGERRHPFSIVGRVALR